MRINENLFPLLFFCILSRGLHFQQNHLCKSVVSILMSSLLRSIIQLLEYSLFRKRATFKTWTRTLDPDPEKPGPGKTWTLKILDPKKPGP